jgi:hypothetical protein
MKKQKRKLSHIKTREQAIKLLKEDLIITFVNVVTEVLDVEIDDILTEDPHLLIFADNPKLINEFMASKKNSPLKLSDYIIFAADREDIYNEFGVL